MDLLLVLVASGCPTPRSSAAAHRPDVQHAYALRQVFHHAPRALQPIRDVILDRTPLMQKVVGDSTPVSILTQLGEIDRAEARFTALLGGGGEAHDTDTAS